MPTNFLYGAIGADVRESGDGLLRLPWPVFRVLGISIGAIISVIAMIAWALLLWGIIGAVIGFSLNAAYRVFCRNQAN